MHRNLTHLQLVVDFEKLLASRRRESHVDLHDANRGAEKDEKKGFSELGKRRKRRLIVHYFQFSPLSLEIKRKRKEKQAKQNELTEK
jgi:hypothetical protein